MAYRIYVTDVLRLMNENVANLCNGKYSKLRYIEAITPKSKKQQEQEKKSAKELVNEVVSKTGIKLVKSNGN